MSVHVFGVRHHGPGCARALRAALTALAPDVVLIEGPPDANDVIALAADAAMVPPVALLVHAVGDPKNAAFYPFATFSPEWQALRYAAELGISARFMDLPCATTLTSLCSDAQVADVETSPEEVEVERALRDDPIALLAEAAGFGDPEQWWDVQVEQRVDARGLFESITEAMASLRALREETRPRELRREAHMRTVIRAAQKEGHQRIAVVTGAWHAPALAASGSARVDRDLLKALPKIKVEATWIPWTNSRLALHSGYGAGVTSPGWYAHLWRYGERAQVVWTTEAARLLRREDLDASSASVIETVRLADALAALRELPMPGLTELREAIESVLVAGDVARLALIRHRLEVGDAIGEVPDHGRQVPIMRDFQRQVKSLRLTLSPELSTLDLDLRRENDLARSRLLHRLTILDVRWGSPLQTGRGAGTFREAFQLRWEPELAVALIAANLHGNTVDVAAVRALIERARAADLPQLTQLIERALRAELPAAIDPLLRELDARAASSSDVRTQMEALEPLVRVARYGDVRGTRAEHVLPVLHALFERIVVSLAPACAQLDDDAVAAMVAAIGRAHQACLLLEDQSLCGDWLDALAKLAAGAQSHARVRGRGARLLFEQGRLESAELLRHASLALSASVEPARAAQWIEGLMEGEAMLLVHQTELLGVLDSWVVQLPAPAFQAMLPLLRRAFSSLSPAERRSVARGVRTRGGASGQVASSAAAERLDPARMKRIVPVLAQVLGVDHA